MTPQMLGRINVTTGSEEADMIPVDFQFSCVMPDEETINDLAEWIDCFFHPRVQ